MPSPEGDDSWVETRNLGSVDEKVAKTAHDHLVAKLERPLLALIERRVGRNNGVAKEICQDCFLKLWSRRKEVARDTAGSPFNWLAVVARHRIVDWLRRETAKKRKGDAPTLSLDELAKQGRTPSTLGPDPEQSAMRAERYRKALSARERVIVALKVEGGYSDAEISAMAGLEPAALRVKWEVIRDKLQRNGLGPSLRARTAEEGRSESLGLSERG
jgi:RNA polymerase sigma factor (sigma-70 family)